LLIVFEVDGRQVARRIELKWHEKCVLLRSYSSHSYASLMIEVKKCLHGQLPCLFHVHWLANNRNLHNRELWQHSPFWSTRKRLTDAALDQWKCLSLWNKETDGISVLVPRGFSEETFTKGSRACQCLTHLEMYRRHTFCSAGHRAGWKTTSRLLAVIRFLSHGFAATASRSKR
jgi:hypothetical protein